MSRRSAHAEEEAAHWAEALPTLDIEPSELLAATRLTMLFVAQSRLDSVALRDFERDGVSGPDDFPVIALLRRSGTEGLTNAEIVKRLGGSKSGTSNRLDRFVAGGLVERVTLQYDRRTHANALTTKGQETADQILLAVAQARRKIFTGLSPQEIAQFADTLAKMLQEVDPRE